MSLAGWRIKGIFCGYDHSWVSIDEGDPYIPENEYIPPSPVKNNDESFSTDNNISHFKDEI